MILAVNERGEKISVIFIKMMKGFVTKIDGLNWRVTAQESLTLTGVKWVVFSGEGFQKFGKFSGISGFRPLLSPAPNVMWIARL
jgi:hypothetical protein